MSLTAFQRVRRMKQVEEMKPENIEQKAEEQKIEPLIEEMKPEIPKEEKIEQPAPRGGRRRK